MLRAQRFMWKGKLVSEKVYKQRLAQTEAGKKGVENKVSSRKRRLAENDDDESCTDEIKPGEGRRLVELPLLGQELWCCSCKECLSLEYIESEHRRGLGSILLVRCHKCLLINEVVTGKQHSAKEDARQNTRFDVNSKAALGMVHAGIGHANLNKLLACLNVPTIDFKTFKRYEAEIGEALGQVAKKSCEDAAILERELTIKHAATIQDTLPECMKSCFYSPENSEQEESVPVTFDTIVRIMASYDMGWTTKGSGRDYDSLNGFGCIVGNFSQMVLDFSTCNRKCKKCDMGRSPFDHDCRLNFYGSAKAMEAHVADRLVNKSTILKSANLQVGILVGDDDSSAIAACRAGASHPIGKLSDVNHTSKTVKKQLYDIEKSCAELSKDGVKYLHRCFTYAMAQNKGKSAAMAQAIRCIPYHAFNDHSQCGQWCGFIQDPQNYDHKIVPGGFHDKNLFAALKDNFEKLASNAAKFSVGVSSNVNESLNASMASKAQKSKCMSLTASSDIRWTGTIAQKNQGEAYTQNVNGILHFSPGKHHSRHVSRIGKIQRNRKSKVKTHLFKQRRAILKKYKKAMRYRREAPEKKRGITYESNCASSEPAVVECNNVLSEDEGTSNEDIPIVYVDLETGGLKRTCDILQIAAKCGKHEFNVYVTPTKEISAAASAVHGLRKYEAELMLHGKKVVSVPMRIAVANFLEFLKILKKKCYIAAHNLGFDGPRLTDAIIACLLQEEFGDIVIGFIDTLSVIKKETSRTKKGECTLTGLAEWLKISNADAHNACADVAMLEKIISKAKITYDTLVERAKGYSDLLEKWQSDKRIQNLLPSLQSLNGVLSNEHQKRLIKAEITIEKLKDVYSTSGTSGIVSLLGSKINGKAIVTSHKASIDKLLAWLKKSEKVV